MERVLGNIFTRTMHFAKSGDQVQGHTHNFDHVTLVIAGAVRIEYSIESDGVITSQGSREFHAPTKMSGDGGQEAQILIKAGVHHKIIALEDNTHCWCVFSHRDPDTGEVVEAWNGNLEASR